MQEKKKKKKYLMIQQTNISLFFIDVGELPILYMLTSKYSRERLRSPLSPSPLLTLTSELWMSTILYQALIVMLLLQGCGAWSLPCETPCAGTWVWCSSPKPSTRPSQPCLTSPSTSGSGPSSSSMRSTSRTDRWAKHWLCWGIHFLTVVRLEENQINRQECLIC